MEKKRIMRNSIIVVLLAAVFLPGFSKYNHLKARQARLLEGIEKLRTTEVDLRRRQERLNKDTVYIEKIAREKLQVAKKGETVVRVEKKYAK